MSDPKASTGQPDSLAQAKLAEKAKLIEAQRARALAYAEVFGLSGSRTERQRLVWADLMGLCAMNRTTAEGKPIDPNLMLLIEGRRQVALHISLQIEASLQPPPGA